jgi:predicted metal-dependent hydrolase
LKTSAEYFEEGIELFNAGRFFECHEAWEQVWNRSTGAEKVFYQGLIQASVAILHAERGNPAGARTLCAKAMLKLDPVPAEHLGLAIGELRAAVKDFIAAATAENRAELPVRPRLRRL